MERKLWTGVAPPEARPGFAKPYRGKTKDELRDVSYAGELGLAIESQLPGIWNGKVSLGDDDRTQLMEAWKIQECRYMPLVNQRDVYSGSAALTNLSWETIMLDEDWRTRTTFSDQEFNTLLMVLEKYHGPRIQELASGATAYDLPTNKTYYFWAYSMALARETLWPTFARNPKDWVERCGHSPMKMNGTWVFDVPYAIDGKICAGQFDAVILPEDVEAADNFDLLTYLETGQKYSIVEIKLPGRPRFASGKRLSSPRSWDLREAKHRMGRLVEWWEGKFNSPEKRAETPDYKYRPFPLPEQIVFCYMTVQSPAIHFQNVRGDAKFLEEWSRDMRYLYEPDFRNGHKADREEELRITNLLKERGMPIYLSTALKFLLKQAAEASNGLWKGELAPISTGLQTGFEDLEKVPQAEKKKRVKIKREKTESAAPEAAQDPMF